MVKSLVIVESPAKAKTINKILGKDYKVAACYGHVRDLPVKELGVEIENGFKPKYVTPPAKQKTIKELNGLAQDAEMILVATDPDREGEAICWHLIEILKKHNGSIKRILFNEITAPAVRSAVEHPLDVNLNLVNAQQARRILDRIVGYKISPLLWRRIKGSSSAGRVQSVAVRLICEREDEIRKFIPVEYWTIEGLFANALEVQLKAGLYSVDGKRIITGDPDDKKKIEDGLRIETEEQARQLLADIQKENYRITSVVQKPKTRQPFPPYITSTLQQDAARRLGFTGDRTMRIAQQLYEGVDIEDETVGLITYMRTDSTRIAGEAIDSVRTLIRETFGEKYLPDQPNFFRKSSGAQDAHEAIRPTLVTKTPEDLKHYLSRDQYKLYELIWKRFVACQMEAARYRTTTIEITDDRFVFRATGSILEFDGFTRIYNVEGNDKDQSLPQVQEGEALKLLQVDPSQHFTKPPARYNDASLIKELEERGIGRPSTYATIVKTIVDRKYVERENRYFKPTELGELVTHVLIENFPDVMDIGFTAHVEEQLDKIEEGQEQWTTTLDEFYKPFEIRLKEAANGIKESLKQKEDTSEEKCENCGRQLIKKWGRNGWFLACPGYPECKFAKSLNGATEAESTDEVCDKCGKPMAIKSGRTGRFLACTGYPECKNARPISIGVKCPKEGCTGYIGERRSKRGKVFFGCSEYPKCDFVSWYRPINESCPVCQNSYLEIKTTKRDGTVKQCPVKTCKYKEAIDPPAEAG